MANKWKIPKLLEETIRRRDVVCVYCGIVFGNNFCDMASWEHINNKAKDVEGWNIALCCRSCNSSKGVKKIESWFKTPYCLNKNINKKTVSDIVKKYIDEGRD